MEKKGPYPILEEVIYGSSDSRISKQIAKLEKKGVLKKIAPRLYTSNLIDSAEEIVRRNLFAILGKLYPGAVLSHRSALEFKPTSSNQLFLTYKYTRKAKLPGLIIRFLEGEGSIGGDNPLANELYVSQRERAFLENLQVSRKTGPDSKTLALSVIEERLEQIIRVNGEEELNKVRDRAKIIAEKLAMQKEFTKLNVIISALLSTHPAKLLKSPVATARAFGVPYDKGRLELFELLFRALKQQEFKFQPENNQSNKAFKNFAFFESYFSNYIEGTVFSLEDAKQIIETQLPLQARNEDSHDILGTYKIVSNRVDMSLIPKVKSEILNLLKKRHKVLLSARKNKQPGKFKDKNNFAGQTSFVDKTLVQGTLIKSFDFYNILDHPFARAAYIMFVVSEVHPFLDGNGRIARIMMNAELVKENQVKIIIPTVYRDDYLGALRKLTRKRDPRPYIKMLVRAQEFSKTITGENFSEMQLVLAQSNAFYESSENQLKIKDEA